MHEVTQSIAFLDTPSLDAAIRASLGVKSLGVSGSSFADSSTAAPVRLLMDDTASPADDAAAQALAVAHDPVFITVDKTKVVDDGIDVATISVRAPKPGAAAVVLLVNGTDCPVTLTTGAASVTLKSSTPAVLTISVKNPANRCATVLTITAQ